MEPRGKDSIESYGDLGREGCREERPGGIKKELICLVWELWILLVMWSEHALVRLVRKVRRSVLILTRSAASQDAKWMSFHTSLLNSRTKSLLVTSVIQWSHNCTTKIGRKTIIISLT
jgi:hypothetical protein